MIIVGKIIKKNTKFYKQFYLFTITALSKEGKKRDCK